MANNKLKSEDSTRRRIGYARFSGPRKEIEELIKRKDNLDYPIIDIEEHLFKGYSEKLIEYYQEKLKIKPKKIKIWVKLCAVYLLKEQDDKLIDSALQALKIDDKNKKILAMLVVAYGSRGEKEKEKDIVDKFDLPSFFRVDLISDLRKVSKKKIHYYQMFIGIEE